MNSRSTQDEDSQVEPKPEPAKRSPATEETVYTSSDASAPSGPTPSSQVALSGALGPEFGRYRIIRTLGSGGMGAVYLAHDSQLDRNVALKVPKFGQEDSTELLERFYREARSMATLRHPNLCAVFDVGEQAGTHFLTMAYIEGTELSDLMRDSEAADALDAVEIVRKVALALSEAHQAGVVHRDLKPSNIMIDRRGEPIVMDFGLARREQKGEAEITLSGAIIGTPAYMPPEQIEGDQQSIGPVADIYSLGVIFYQLLCRRLPFAGSVTSILAQVLTKEPLPPSHYRHDVDSVLESICLRAMAKTPTDRYQSMPEFVAALDEWRSTPERERAKARRQQAADRPAIVSGFQHDLFVCYCAADDEPPPGSISSGWVSTLIDNLDWRLRQLNGDRAAVSLWMDDELAHQPAWDEATIQRLEKTAAVIVVLSPGWAASEWNRDSSRFLELLQRRHLPDECVFLIEQDQLDADRRPRELIGQRALPFWKLADGSAPVILGYPHPKPDVDNEYYARIDDLARAIHKRLHTEIGKPERSKDDAAESQTVDAVYLAEVTDDLDPLRDEVERYLNQSGFEVLPSSWYPREPDEFQEAMRRDLNNCLLYVQLVGPFSGKKPPGESRSYAGLQFEVAGRHHIPLLQWRDLSLDHSQIRDPDHSEFVNGKHVQAIELELFKREVVSRALLERKLREAESVPAEAAEDKAFVFINVGPDDLPLTDDLCDLLEQSGYSYALPMHEGRPDEIRQDLEANLLDCDGLIVVYGEIAEQWVREQLRQWRKILYRREKPLRALAVYDGPPIEKQRLGMRLPRMRVIDCRIGLQEDEIQRFLNTLAGG